MLKYTDITKNTYIQSWTVMEIMAREKCGLLAVPRTVPAQLTRLSHIRNHPHNIASATQSLLMRAENCIATGGGHFEQLL